MKIKIKKLHPNAVIPSYAKTGDAGLDLTAISVQYDSKRNVIVYDTGLAVEIPEGYVGLLFPRSSIYKTSLILSNSVGILDSGYRGSIMFKFRPDAEFWTEASKDYKAFQHDLENGMFNHYETAEAEYRDFILYTDIYKINDRIGQLIILPYPQIEFEEVEELSDTERGDGGYGSTGN